jgi:hypothetical protein
MSRTSLTGFAVAMLVAVACSSTVWPADAFYLGTWKITTAMEAPWIEPGRKADPAEMKTLVGKTVGMKPAEITGPRQVACKGPQYVVKDYPADFLFQGAFGEMQRRDSSVDPVKVAAKYGFKGASKWKTLETGCATELDFHFQDPTTTTFGLNDYIFTLKKQ